MSPEFTPVTALIGGVLIGAAASWLLLFNGRIAGVQGMVAGLSRGALGDAGFRAWFVVGLVAAGVVAVLAAPGSLAPAPRAVWLLGIAGLLVGAGTRLANGCTSGHGVCGLGRGSLRSLAAVMTFIAAGVGTVALLRAFGVSG